MPSLAMQCNDTASQSAHPADGHQLRLCGRLCCVVADGQSHNISFAAHAAPRTLLLPALRQRRQLRHAGKVAGAVTPD